MMKHIRRLGLSGLAMATLQLWAHEEPFGYVRGAQTEARGEWEITQWATGRIGKESGRYLGLDLSTELEYGVTDRLQVAGYLHTDYHLARHATGNSETFADRDQFGLNGASLEFKYQIADASQDPWGVALYFEPGYKSIDAAGGERVDEIEFETRLIIQKDFYAHRLLAAVNFVIEPELERERGADWETRLKMGVEAGVSWRLSSHWWLGLEARLDSRFDDADLSKSKYAALFIGPTLHYSRKNHFATLTVLPQAWGWPDQQGTGGLHLDERERIEVRLKFGFEF